MLDSNKILVSILLLALGGLFVNPLRANGQCSANIVETTDSTQLIEAKSFKGITFTKNRSLGSMEDINGDNINVTIKNISELPSPAQIVTPTIQEICSLENTFKDWWNAKVNRERIEIQGVSLNKETINRFNRQYIAYDQNSQKYIQVTFFDSQIFDDSEWKVNPITCDHCWPNVFVLNYEVESQQIILNTNFK